MWARGWVWRLFGSRNEEVDREEVDDDSDYVALAYLKHGRTHSIEMGW